MTAVIQRVSESSVSAEGIIIGAIGAGFNILLGVAQDDEESDCAYLAEKIVHLRVFEDGAGKLNRSLLDTKGEALVISQFTLLGDCSQGRRPSFIKAARPEKAIPLYEKFLDELSKLGVQKVAAGQFGADMRVSIVNDGPVTIIMDTKGMRGAKR